MQTPRCNAKRARYGAGAESGLVIRMQMTVSANNPSHPVPESPAGKLSTFARDVTRVEGNLAARWPLKSSQRL
jgi:hypothetical protein